MGSSSWYDEVVPNDHTMQINRDTLQELREFQEDCASHFTDENFPMSGEVYWTCVESLATAKLAELRGELVADEV